MTCVTQVVSAGPSELSRAAEVIRAGGLVAFPTETVYGLGANAFDAAAVARVFEAKGRPATNPVIVHVSKVEQVDDIASGLPAIARRLAERFWPGPLTLVLPRGPRIPDIVAAGGPTVAVRLPAHPVARALLDASGVPLAGPSANRSTCLSPTRAEHVLRGLSGRIDMVIDAGPCPGGIESTVIDVTTSPPTLLRPGLLPLATIQEVVGDVTSRPTVASPVARSPGQMTRHYSPLTPIEFAPDDGRRRVVELIDQGLRVGWLAFEGSQIAGLSSAAIESMPDEPASYAARMYDALHRLDLAGVDRIVVALPPEGDAWLAIHDRLGRMG